MRSLGVIDWLVRGAVVEFGEGFGDGVCVFLYERATAGAVNFAEAWIVA